MCRCRRVQEAAKGPNQDRRGMYAAVAQRAMNKSHHHSESVDSTCVHGPNLVDQSVSQSAPG